MAHDMITLSTRVEKQIVETFKQYDIAFKVITELDKIVLEYCKTRTIKGNEITFTSVLSIEGNEYTNGIPVYFLDHWQTSEKNGKETDNMDTLVLFKNLDSIIEYLELNYIPDIEIFESA